MGQYRDKANAEELHGFPAVRRVGNSMSENLYSVRARSGRTTCVPGADGSFGRIRHRPSEFWPCTVLERSSGCIDGSEKGCAIFCLRSWMWTLVGGCGTYIYVHISISHTVNEVH
ncbi:hypothetical protein BJX96DRAFT_146712 [Aspergillus floccosus]